MFDELVPAVCTIAPPVNIPLHLAARAQAVAEEEQLAARRLSDAVEVAGPAGGHDAHRGPGAREALAKKLQRMGRGGSGEGVCAWQVPVSSVAGYQGTPLMAVGCKDQIHVLTILDGENCMEIVCCLEPKAGAVVALEWSPCGRRLACCSERELLVFSPQPAAAGFSSGGGGDWCEMSRAVWKGAEWYVSHRCAAASQHSAVSWMLANGNAFLLAGGTMCTAWKVPEPRVTGREDWEARKVMSLVRVVESEVSGGGGAAAAKASVAQGAVRGDAGHHQVAVSPGSRWVASCPAFGRVVSLKYMQGGAGGAADGTPASGGKLVMLPHPRTVLSIQWRPRHQRTGRMSAGDEVDVLLTCGSDGVARVWKEVREVPSREDWRGQSGHHKVAGKAPIRAAAPGGSFVLCYSVGYDEVMHEAMKDEMVYAAAWVISVVPRHRSVPDAQQLDASSQADAAADDGGEGDSATADDGGDQNDEAYSLVSTVTGNSMCLWALSGLATAERRGVKASCVHRADLTQFASSQQLPFVDVRVFRCSVSPWFTVDTGEHKSRLMMVLTDSRGVVTSSVVAVGSHTTHETTRPTGTFDAQPLVLSTMHSTESRFLCEGEAEMTVLSDAVGSVSVWWWDLSAVGRGTRHLLTLAGLFDRIGPGTAACDGKRLLVAREGSNMMEMMEMRTCHPVGAPATVEPHNQVALSRSSSARLQAMLLVGMTKPECLCAVGLLEDGALWCGGAWLPTQQGRLPSDNMGYGLTSAKMPQMQRVTCIHAADSKSSRSARQPYDDRGEEQAYGYWFAGDSNGMIHLLCANFGCGTKAEGSVHVLSTFGDGAMGGVLHIRAQALGCVSSVHSDDPQRVRIWRTSAASDSFCEVGSVSVPGLSGILSLSWCEPVPLFPLLAAATKTSVYVVSRAVGSTSADTKWAWALRWGTSVSDCSSVAWTADCRLLAACVGGIFVLEPSLMAKHRGASVKPAALASHAGYSLCPAHRTAQGGASGQQVMHEMLRELLLGLPVVHPQTLRLHWSAGHNIVVDRVIEELHEAVMEEGAGVSSLAQVGRDVLDAMLESSGESQGKKEEVETASALASEGFDTFGSSGMDSATSTTAARSLKIVEAVNEAVEEGEPVNSTLLTLKPTLKALHAALSGTVDRLDEPAQRFTFAVHLHDAKEDERREIEERERGGGAQEGKEAAKSREGMMGMVDLAWAMLSGEQDTLIRKLIPDEASWEDLRFLGVPLWITSPNHLKAVAEQLSKSQFKKDRDPTQCALLYLALDKKSTLTAMFKLVKNDSLHKFFLRDFSDAAHRGAAVKNACVLLSQHRYSLAAAFFMLAGQFDDAFQTVLVKMNDPMLAILIARLQAKSDSGAVYEKAMVAVLDKWNADGQTIAASLRFEEALQKLVQGGLSSSGTLELVRVVSIYTRMRSDPRVRLSLEKPPEAAARVKDTHSTTGGGATAEALMSGGGATAEAFMSGGGATAEALMSGGGATAEAFMSGGGATAEAFMSGGGATAEALMSGGGATAEALIGGGGKAAVAPFSLGLEEEGFVQQKQRNKSTAEGFVKLLREEVRLRQALAWEFTGEGLTDLAMDQCRKMSQLESKVVLEVEGMSVGGLSAGGGGGQTSQEELSCMEKGKTMFEKVTLWDLRCAVTDRSVRASLPLTPDYVHPSSLQQRDPSKVTAALELRVEALSKSSMHSSPATLLSSALDECAALARLDCYTALSLSVGTASEGFAYLTYSSLAIPEALRSLPTVTRTASSSSYFLRLAQRFTAAGSIMAEASGQPPWLGDCLHIDALHRRMCLATFFCSFLAFWHAHDTAGLQLLVCGMWDERASKSCDSAVALSSYAQRALTRLSSLHRCEWARVWARYEKQVLSLHASSGKVQDHHYALQTQLPCTDTLRIRMLDLLVLERLCSLLGTASSFGRSDDDVCSMVSVSSEALRRAKERTLHLVHGTAAQVSLDVLASSVQPYLSANLSHSADGSDAAGATAEEGARGHLRRLLLTCDDRARVDMHKVAISLLAHFPSQPRASSLKLGKIEVLATQKGEVFRSLCLRSDDRAGSVLAVCSNKSIREVHCRPDAVSVVGSGHEGVTAALLLGPIMGLSEEPAVDPKSLSKSRDKSSLSSSELPGDEDAGDAAMANGAAGAMLHTVDGVLEMLWDKVSTSATDVVHSVAEVGSHGSLTGSGGSGAMALAAHPWLPVFVSGLSDGNVLLWGFGAPQPLSSFGSMSAGVVNRMRFDEPGAKFCGCDSSGLAGVWNFELARGSGLDRRPVDLIQAHSKRCYDVCFLDKGTLLGTAGTGSASSVCVWDLLMPPSCACVAALNLHDSSANSIAHCEQKHLLVSGGNKGDLCITDTRTWRCLRTVPNAHKLCTRAVCFSPGGKMVVSGSTDGDIKFWDVGDLVTGAGEASCVSIWSAAHEKGTFVGSGSSTPLATYGVMELQFSRQGSHLISCGADGRLLRRSFVYM